MDNNYILQVRPSNPREGQHLRPEDFYRTNKCTHIVFEAGIYVEVVLPRARTIILKNDIFCVVVRKVTVNSKTGNELTRTLSVCLPEHVRGREVLFASPTLHWSQVR